MKRLIPCILTAIVILGSTFSCEKAPLLEISGSSTINIGNNGGTQSITFTANRDWSVSASDSWVKVSPSSGAASDSPVSVKVSIDPNTTYDARSCTITVRADELSQTISVNQDTGLGLIVSKKEYSLSNAAQAIEVEVQSNVQYNVTIDESCSKWITESGTKGLSSDKIVFNISANDTFDNRIGKITFSQVDGSLSETITITQGQTDGIFITTPDYDLSNASHTLSVEVRANVDFTVTPSVDWIKYVETKALESSIITLSIEANEDYDQRAGVVEVKQVNGNLSGTINIKQAENYGLFVSSESASITSASQDVEVEVKYNVDFEVIVPDEAKSMIQTIRYEGEGSGTKALLTRKYIITVNENSTYSERVAPITFKQRDGSLSGTFTITQAQNDAVLVEKSEYEVGPDDYTLEIPIKANVDCEVVIPEDLYWITVVEDPHTKALVDLVTKLHISFNPGYDPRTAQIIIKQKETNVSQTITITQLARKWLDADPIYAKAQGGPYVMRVRYNIPYHLDVETLPDWAHYVSTNPIDKNLDEITIQVDQHTGYADRVKEFKIKAKDGSEEIVREIRQEKVIAVLYDESEIVVDYKAQTYEFRVKSNVELDYRVFSYDWIFDSSIRKIGKDGDLDVFVCPIRVIQNDGVKRKSRVFLYWKDGTEHMTAEIPVTQNSLEFIVETPGTLSSLLDIDNIGKYTFLKISGSINGDDIITIKRCLNLVYLDLEDVTIVSGGAPYDGSHTTQNNSISEAMFKGTSIQTFILPRNLETIGRSAFGTSNVSSITMFEGIKYIGPSAFYNCKYLTTAILPDSVNTIDSGAFSNCYNITEIHLPEYLNSLGSTAFRFLHNLTSVDIPEDVTRIEDMVFDGCESINEVFLRASPHKLYFVGTNIFTSNVYKNATLHIKKGLTKADYWDTEFANFLNIVADLD